ncbi:MAG: thermonuclease family protein [Candidatus Aenigmarchaeota archaeon]|nr:thermonuclease family protein [Candidatus Aenigmarchaeota archaeon]
MLNKTLAFFTCLVLVMLTAGCIQQANQAQTKRMQDPRCEGTADCFYGNVSRILDGDTIEVDGDSVRLVLVAAPETYEQGGAEATSFIAQNCPVGSEVLVDQDDWQMHDDYGRMLAVVWCNGKRVNEESIEQGFSDVYRIFCSQSEFGDDEWAVKLGCSE